MGTRKSDVFFGCLAAVVGLLIILFLHAYLTISDTVPLHQERVSLVKKFGFADLCLFTDARYTRNPVMTDMTTPFQDHPGSLEHFPSGTVMTPPVRNRHDLD